MDDSLGTLFSQCWASLAQAARGTSHGWRLGSLATVGRDGFPKARTVVLRGAKEEGQELSAYTDPRTPKWRELRAHPRAELLFWDAESKVQLRCSGPIRLHQDDEIALAARQELPEHVAGDYGALTTPGEPLAHPQEGTELGSASQWHFGVIVMAVESMDWLALRRDGHRRACFQKEGSRWQMSWVQP